MPTLRRRVDSDEIDEFIFDTDDSTPDFIVEEFTDWLSEYISEGARFVDGQMLQYGYTFLNCSVQSRVLRLLAPDFQGMPIEWSNNLGPSFRIIAAHKYIPETFGWTPDIPSLGNTAIVGRTVTDAIIALTRNCAADVRYIGSDEDLSDDMSIVEIVVIRFQGKADFWLQIYWKGMADLADDAVGMYLANALGSPVIISDDSPSPYSGLLLTPGGTIEKIYLDIEKLDEHSIVDYKFG